MIAICTLIMQTVHTEIHSMRPSGVVLIHCTRGPSVSFVLTLLQLSLLLLYHPQLHFVHDQYKLPPGVI